MLVASCIQHFALLALSSTVEPLGARQANGMTRRAALLGGFGAAAAGPGGAALARPEGVNKPELLPSYQTNVIQMEQQKFLTSGEVKALDTQLSLLEKQTGVRLRVLCQSFPNTPGLAIKEFWNVDDNSIIMVVDKGSSKEGRSNTVNILNFNVGRNVDLNLPNQFWTRLQNTFGNTFFVRDNGEDVAILRAVDTIDYCLRDYCTDVPMQFRNPSKAMYGDQDPAAKLFGGNPFDTRVGFSEKKPDR